ncbi:TraB/GumN family protein [Cesiribacter sp. SM1]|uniref:TraB/GumN family protein n=1 Tax=Cesiribacter sp. SM1 TaxID=2861196 RepID=UPI001CD3C073|nr:TraB/GumN family protein [Cesiribacter sp. SM1]
MNFSRKFVLSSTFFLLRIFAPCFVALYVLMPARAIAQEQEVAEQSLLWKISGGGLKQPSYLYGTIHAICVDDMLVSEPMLQAMQNSKQLALEVNISDVAELKQLQAGMQMKTPSKLSDYLSEGEYRLVERFYRDSLGVALNQLQSMKPFFISSLLYSKLLNCPVLSYEMQLSRMMGLQNKAVVGLEGASDQLKALDAIPYQEQAKLLLEAVKNYEELRADFWNMVVSYKNQDLESLFYIVRETSLGMKNYEKILLQDRNRRWMPTVETLARNKPTFFAVGAAHLPGEDGLISLLRRRGYTVEPLFY